MTATYEQFLAAKTQLATSAGFDVHPDDINLALKPHQAAIVRWAVGGGRRAIFASFGLGKCHGAGTPILMADGAVKPVEKVRVGDQLMGDDSKPRNVLSLARGQEQMYQVTLKNGDSYTCNESHIFSVRMSNKHAGNRPGDLVDMPLREWSALPDYAKRNCYKHYKVGVDFPSQAVPMDPYLFGAWLGDGSSRGLSWTINDRDQEIVHAILAFARERNLMLRQTQGRGCVTYHLSRTARGHARSCDEYYFVRDNGAAGKRIDRRYLVNSREVRLQTLAGIVDTDGYLADKCFEVATKFPGLRDDLLFLARSLGFAVSSRAKVVKGTSYWVVVISGHTDLIPCRTRKKAAPRRQIKDPLVYGFTVEPLGEGDYFGFVIDGNHRYLLGDFTVTHNTIMQLEIVRLTLAETSGRGLIVCPLGVRQEFIRDAVEVLETERPRFIRTAAEAGEDGIYLTNYETVRDRKLDPRGFQVVSLDEAAILRGFGGTKTFREFMRLYEGTSNYRFVATATPSPNDYIELLAYAAFLDVLDVGQAKTRWFKRDSEHADRLTLLPHMEDEFWLWCSSWALFVNKPSDLCSCQCHREAVSDVV